MGLLQSSVLEPYHRPAAAWGMVRAALCATAIRAKRQWMGVGVGSKARPSRAGSRHTEPAP